MYYKETAMEKVIEIKNIKKVGFDLQSYNLFANKTAFGKSG